MSGHSKWANIKHKKAKMDAQKGKVFTRITREITVAAREGGGDLGGNARLRLLVDKAKAANMPRENVARAIKKGTGEIEGVRYESIRYEGYGPGGIAIIVETLTDNKNRAVSDVRHAFSKHGGHLAESGSVSWMFTRKGTIMIKANGKSEDDVLEALLDYNVDDISSRENIITITCAPEDLESVKKGAQKVELTIAGVEVAWVAKDPITLSKEDEERAYKLLDAIDDLDDVQGTYANLN